MSYDMYIQNQDKTVTYKFPIVPPELPQLEFEINNEVFSTYKGTNYTAINKNSTKTLTLECWLPTKKYNWAKSDILAKPIIDLINNALTNGEFVHFYIVNKSDIFLSGKFTIDAWSYGVLWNGNYSYTLTLRDYESYEDKGYVLGWNEDNRGWWYCTNVENYTWYSNEWQYINGNWFWFDAEGYAYQNKWLLQNNKWYYMNNDCHMLHDKWEWIDGKCYYFYSNGEMASNTTVEGWVVGPDGAWIQ